LYITPAKRLTFVHYNGYMDATDLINYKALSQLLSNNDSNIRRGRVPKRYQDQVKELEALLNYYISKQPKQL